MKFILSLEKKLLTKKKVLQINKFLQKPVYINLYNLIKNKTNLKNNSNYFFKFTVKGDKILSRLKFGLNIGNINKKNTFPCNICFNAKLPNKSILNKPSTFKWGLIRNKDNSLIVISNFSLQKKIFRKANLKMKIWNEFKDKYIEKKIEINDNGSYWFLLNKHQRVKKFLNNKSGWMTIESDNPNVHGWYFEILNSGSIGADHLF